MHLLEKMWGNDEVIRVLQSSMNTACLQMQCTSLSLPSSSCNTMVSDQTNQPSFSPACQTFVFFHQRHFHSNCTLYFRTCLQIFACYWVFEIAEPDEDFSRLYFYFFFFLYSSFSIFFSLMECIHINTLINCYIFHLCTRVDNLLLINVDWLVRFHLSSLAKPVICLEQSQQTERGSFHFVFLHGNWTEPFSPHLQSTMCQIEVGSHYHRKQTPELVCDQTDTGPTRGGWLWSAVLTSAQTKSTKWGGQIKVWFNNRLENTLE